MSYHITDLGRTIQRFQSDWEAATTPATTHTQARRGLGGANDMGHHLARVNSPATRYESCHLSRRGMAWLVALVTWLLAALLIAWLAGGGAHKAVASVAHAFEEAAR